MATQESYNLSSELKELLQKLASLYNHKNSKVALSARKVNYLSRMKLIYVVSSCNFLNSFRCLSQLMSHHMRCVIIKWSQYFLNPSKATQIS